MEDNTLQPGNAAHSNSVSIDVQSRGYMFSSHSSERTEYMLFHAEFDGRTYSGMLQQNGNGVRLGYSSGEIHHPNNMIEAEPVDPDKYGLENGLTDYSENALVRAVKNDLADNNAELNGDVLDPMDAASD